MDSGFNVAYVYRPPPLSKLSPLEKCKFFDSSKMAFLQSKKPLFEETKTKPRSLLQKSRDERYLEKYKFFDSSKMTFQKSKKPPFEKATSSNDKTKVSSTETYKGKMYGIFYQNHGLTHFEICKFFGYSKMTFVTLKRPLLRKQHHQTTKPSSLLQKSRLEGFWNF